VQLHALSISVPDGGKSKASYSWLRISKEILLYLPDRMLIGFHNRPERVAENTSVLSVSRLACSSQCQ
jgi:hypothetical protein